jgi:hypothetical protein
MVDYATDHKWFKSPTDKWFTMQENQPWPVLLEKRCCFIIVNILEHCGRVAVFS